MTKRPFSPYRRRLLKSGVGALGVFPVAGLAGPTGPVPISFPTEETTTCIRSPWVYYALRNTSLGEQGDSLDTGNEGFPGLVPVTTDPGQWSDSFDWWTGNGADRALIRAWDADPARFSSVVLPGRSACLIGMQLEKPQATPGTETLLLIGRLLPGGAGRGLHLKINSVGKPLVTLWDDDGNSFALAGKNVVTETNGGVTTLFIYLDHRPDGSRTLSIHQFETGTCVQSSRVKSTHALGAITGGAAPDNEIIVGARRPPSGILDQFYLGRLRGLTILNFGTTPPANMSGIMEGLSSTDMTPGSFMEGV